MRKKKCLVLVDADMFAFRACAGVEEEIEWDHDLWTLYSHVSDAVQAFTGICGRAQAMIDEQISRQSLPLSVPDYREWLFCFSDLHGYNFRKDILPTYKANREGRRKPVAYKALVDYIFCMYHSKQISFLEADDVIGVTAAKSKREVLIISGDKDMKQIPGWHYDFLHEDLFYVGETEALTQFYMQVLTGDATDGYSGCPGIGPKKAEELLDKSLTWHTVAETYKKKGLTEEDALVQARCAYILHQKGDLDSRKVNGKRIKLWTPE